MCWVIDFCSFSWLNENTCSKGFLLFFITSYKELKKCINVSFQKKTLLFIISAESYQQKWQSSPVSHKKSTYIFSRNPKIIFGIQIGTGCTWHKPFFSTLPCVVWDFKVFFLEVNATRLSERVSKELFMSYIHTALNM